MYDFPRVRENTRQQTCRILRIAPLTAAFFVQRLVSGAAREPSHIDSVILKNGFGFHKPCTAVEYQLARDTIARFWHRGYAVEQVVAVKGYNR